MAISGLQNPSPKKYNNKASWWLKRWTFLLVIIICKGQKEKFFYWKSKRKKILKISCHYARFEHIYIISEANNSTRKKAVSFTMNLVSLVQKKK